MTPGRPTVLPVSASYITPECRVGRLEPDFQFGCPKCPGPGYQHPVLGWMPVPCACACHATEEATP